MFWAGGQQIILLRIGIGKAKLVVGSVASWWLAWGKRKSMVEYRSIQAHGVFVLGVVSMVFLYPSGRGVNCRVRSKGGRNIEKRKRTGTSVAGGRVDWVLCCDSP